MKIYTVIGFGPLGDGPCGYKIKASSEDEAISIFNSEFPDEARWGILYIT